MPQKLFARNNMILTVLMQILSKILTTWQIWCKYLAKQTISEMWSPIPRWVLMLAYLAVPVRFLFSLYGICWWVRASRYFLASPKSIIYTRFPFFPNPMRKLSGFTSRWMKFLECMYSILLICNGKQPQNNKSHQYNFPIINPSCSNVALPYFTFWYLPGRATIP